MFPVSLSIPPSPLLQLLFVCVSVCVGCVCVRASARPPALSCLPNLPAARSVCLAPSFWPRGRGSRLLACSALPMCVCARLCVSSLLVFGLVTCVNFASPLFFLLAPVPMQA